MGIHSLKSPSPPRHLTSDGRKLWKAVLVDHTIADGAGLALLTQACEALDRLRQVQRQIAADGLTVGGRAHPLLKVEAECRRQILACARALRLDVSPSEF